MMPVATSRSVSGHIITTMVAMDALSQCGTPLKLYERNRSVLTILLNLWNVGQTKSAPQTLNKHGVPLSYGH